MFEFGRDLRRLFEKARESEDLGWLELIGVGLVEVEARQQSIDAGRVSCPRPFETATRASAVWREHARRTGAAASLERAAASAADAKLAAQGDDQKARARQEAARTLLLRFDLCGNPDLLDTAAETLRDGAPPRRAALSAQQDVLHARIGTRQARLGEAATGPGALAEFDRALRSLVGDRRTGDEELLLERAALALEIGIASRDPALLDQAGRDLRALVEDACPDQRPLSRARALALCGAGMSALASIAGDARVHDQAGVLFDAAADQFTPDHSPMDWTSIQILRADRGDAPLLPLVQAEALTEGGGLILGALARERRLALEVLTAARCADLSALSQIETDIRKRLVRPAAGATPLDWATNQIGLAHIAQARARLTGVSTPALGLILHEAAETAREQGAPALAHRAEQLIKREESQASQRD